MTYSNANFTPGLKGYSDIKPFRFWCQKVLPLVYDDSLSYYELLCKVTDYINNIIDDLSATEDNVGALLDAYNQLQDYVNDYFTNLDVQEEINNKLDNLVEDGTLETLIGNYIQPRIDAIQEELDDYESEMTANFNGLQSATESNLQQQNDKIFVLESRMDTFSQLTPGSTTGDAELQDIRVAYDGIVYPTAGDSVRAQVKEIKSDYNSLMLSDSYNSSLFEDGAISATTGENVANSTRVRTKDYIPFTVKSLSSLNTTIRFLLYAYNTNGEYIGGYYNGEFTPTDVTAYSSINLVQFYQNPTYKDYKFKVAIYGSGLTLRVSNLDSYNISFLTIPLKDITRNNLNLDLNYSIIIADNSDLNNLTIPGNYIIPSVATLETLENRPIFSGTGGRLFVLQTQATSRLMQIFIGFNSIYRSVIYVRFYDGTNWRTWYRLDGRNSHNVRILGFNLGKFNYGRDGGLQDNVDEKIANFKKFIGTVNPDITLTCECPTYIDSAEQYQTIPTIFSPLYNRVTTFREDAVFANSFDFMRLEEDGGVYLRDNNATYGGQVARQIIEIDGIPVLLSGGYLTVLTEPNVRYESFVNYLASISSYENSIIYLDTNAYSEEERNSINNAAISAGYVVCNGGYFGSFATLNDESMYRNIDNIFIKGNIKLKNFYVANTEYENLSSDHYAIIADIAMY